MDDQISCAGCGATVGTKHAHNCLVLMRRLSDSSVPKHDYVRVDECFKTDDEYDHWDDFPAYAKMTGMSRETVDQILNGGTTMEELWIVGNASKEFGEVSGPLMDTDDFCGKVFKHRETAEGYAEAGAASGRAVYLLKPVAVFKPQVLREDLS